VALCAVLPLPAAALTVVIANGAAQLFLRVGRTGGATSVVTFTVPAASAGTGTPVLATAPANAGSAQAPNFPAACPGNSVRIMARARAPVANTRTASLRVNSSGNLVSGANTIPFTDFDWTSSDAEIPSGAFSGSTTQLLATFQNSREISVCHQFRFLNSNVYPAGTYTGALIYNLNMP
jgi:hypothetical protein